MSAEKNNRPTAMGTVKAEEKYKKLHRHYITAMTFVQVIIAIILIILTFLTIVGKATAPKPQYTAFEYKVKSGDTLWSIAQETKPDYITMDEYMSWVYSKNSNGKIYPGDVVFMAEVTK